MKVLQSSILFWRFDSDKCDAARNADPLFPGISACEGLMKTHDFMKDMIYMEMHEEECYCQLSW